MFRTALDDQTGELRGHLLTTYLPNLVGEVANPRLQRNEVFSDELALRDLLLADAEQNPEQFSPALLAWLRGDES